MGILIEIRQMEEIDIMFVKISVFSLLLSLIIIISILWTATRHENITRYKTAYNFFVGSIIIEFISTGLLVGYLFINICINIFTKL